MKLTEKQYEKLALKRFELLDQVPFEFRSFLSNIAYNKGRDEEEVVNILEGLVNDFKPAICDYVYRILQEK